MSYLYNLKIKTRLLGNSIALLILFIVVLFSYQYAITQLESAFQQVLSANEHIYKQAVSIENNMQEAQTNDKKFQLHPKIGYSNKALQLAKEVYERAEYILKFSEGTGDSHIYNSAKKIKLLSEVYRGTLQKMVAANLRKGLTPDSGLQGEFRKAAHALTETHVTEHAVAPLLIDLLRLHRAKTIFLSDDSEENIVAFNKKIIAFGSRLKEHAIRAVYKIRLQNALAQFKTTVVQYLATSTPKEKTSLAEMMDKDVALIEHTLESIYVPGVKEKILQIRRFEKDYIKRGGLLYIQKTHQAIKELQEAITQSAMQQKDTVGTLEYLSIYKKNFTEMTNEDRTIILLQKNLRDTARRIELVVKDIVAQAEQNEQNIKEKAFAASRSTLHLAIAISLAAICLGTLLTILITKSITTPLAEIMRAISRINSGDYSVRLDGSSKTETGIIANNFNQMAQTIFTNNWLAAGRTKLATELRENKKEEELAHDIVVFLAKHLNAEIGAIYLADEDGGFTLVDGYSLTTLSNLPASFKLGQGILGEAAREQKTIHLSDVPQDYISINSSLGSTLPRHITAMPLVWHDTVYGVIELASLTSFSVEHIKFLTLASESIAIAIHTTRQFDTTQKLLTATQKQAEELQTQQEELKATNEELEEQAQSLRQSEEELRSQQEELQISNEELEEKTELQEQQKQKILQKNEELQEAWHNIEQKSKEIEAASRYKSEFLANMSHELRTPLNSLLLLAHNLSANKDNNLTGSQVESANIIYNSGQDLLSLINDILDLAKIESGRMEAETSQVNLRGVADWLQSNFLHMATDKQLNFTTTIGEHLPKNIITDRHRLEQILRNLAANAIKFTKQGGVTVSFTHPSPSINLKSSDLNPKYTLAINVTDTGIGIAKENLHTIFGAFKQAEGGTARKYGGTGLGLSISQKLAKLLGGEIQLSSETGHGSTFTLLLPFTPEQTDEKEGNKYPIKSPSTNNDAQQYKLQQIISRGAVEPLEPMTTETPQVPDDRTELTKNDKVILIIEDDLNFAKILINLGQEKGFKCIAAATGMEGLTLAQQYNPGAIVLDLVLPDIDGWQVMESLKNNPTLRHIPVHMMSAQEKTQEAFKKGAIGYLTKPVTEEGLTKAFACLEDAVSKRMRHLLVVEDDPAICKQIVKLIGNGDIQVNTAENGEQAIEQLQTNTIDCMILDIGLPDMSGFALLGQLDCCTNITIPPVIIYTGRELTEEEENSLRKYTDTVIIKGVRSEERLLDETALFLHRVISKMPKEKRKMIASLYDQDTMFNNKQILVVDDDMRNAFALSKILEERGMNIAIAKDGFHALEQLAVSPETDLVLMDIMMPGMDGYETMEKIRSQDKFNNLPIIALTAKAMTEDKDKCMAAGANDYLTKPVEEERLLSMMRVWLYR